MAKSGKIKLDDLHSTLQQDFANDRLAISSNQTGFNGYGFNPLGSVKNLDDNDSAIQYSVGDWTRGVYPWDREGLNANLNPYSTQTARIGATATIKFTGTGLYLCTKLATDQGMLSVVVDGTSYANLDLTIGAYNSGGLVKIVDGLTHGNHTATITHIGKGSVNNGNPSNIMIHYFNVIAQPIGKNLLPPFTQLELSSIAKVISPYNFSINPTVNGFVNNIIRIPVSRNTQYTFDIVTTGGLSIISLDASNVALTTHYNNDIAWNTPLTFTTHVNATQIQINFYNKGGIAGLSSFKNPMLNLGSTALPFETNGYDKVTLATDKLWGKSSAFVGGNRIDALTNVTQSIPEITNLLPNASFERIAPTWANVFQDDFNRADGAVGNGWTNVNGDAWTIVSNTIKAPTVGTISDECYLLNGDSSWTDIKVSYSVTLGVVGGGRNGGVILRYQDTINFYDLTIQDGYARIYKVANSVWTKLSEVAVTPFVNGTTYSCIAEIIGNVIRFSVGSATIYAYDDNFKSGKFGLQTNTSTQTTFDNVVVTAPVPDGWGLSTSLGSIHSFNGNVYKVMNNISISSYAYNTSTLVPVIAGQPYTISVKRKINLYISGLGAAPVINWYDKDNLILTNSIGTYVNVVDTDFTQVVFNVTAPVNAVFCQAIPLLDGISTCEWKEYMFVAGSTIPAWHTKESRCDLISLQNDGQVVVTQGNGASELGYRIEAEDGSISTFWRDKRTVQHWDRVKVWKSGTGWNTYSGTGNSNGTIISSVTTNDTYYISFVGTGIDLIDSCSSDRGTIGVTIDNGTEFNIDLYTPSGASAQRFMLARNLPYGQHTIKIRNTGNKNGLSAGFHNGLDAFDIYVPAIPTNPSPTTLLPVSAAIKADPDNGWVRYNQNEGVLYSGSWSGGSGSAYNGTYSQTNVTNDYAEFSFVGTQVKFMPALTNLDSGILNVSIDGTSIGTIDCYTSSIVWQPSINSTSNVLTLNLHKIRVTNNGTKNASSSNTYTTVGVFEVRNTMYVIDLRKNVAQALIEQKIAEHEAKDLWDAHSWAIKGRNPKERYEITGGGATPSATGWQKLFTITFSKTFTVPPTCLIIDNIGNVLNGNSFSALSATTTTVDIWANVISAGAVMPMSVLAIGY